MSGWTIARDGNVELEHYSTSSLVKLTITDYPDGYDQAPVYRESWFEYDEFDSLKKAIKEIDEILP